MYCPSCENLMKDGSKYCGRCGLSQNSASEKFTHFTADFAWIWRRSWGGFVSGFIGWILVFIISRMISDNIGSVMNNLFTGMICGVFLGTVGGVIEESAYKALCGGLLGTIGGALGGLLNIPFVRYMPDQSLAILATWAVGGAFIGATSGVIERDRKKVIAGVIFGLLGGAVGGYFCSVFYGSVMMEFRPMGWLMARLIEGLSGGLVGAVLWFSVGIIEKLYIFKRREDPSISEKVCEICNAHNNLRFWYCGECGNVLQTSAPRQKLVKTPYRGMERIINALHFLSWLFGVTGVITTPVVFFIFLNHNFFLACISAIFAVLFTYLMIVGFRFISDFLSVLTRLSQPGSDVKH